MRNIFHSFLFLLPLSLALLSGAAAQEKLPFNRKIPFAVPPACLSLRGFSFNEISGRWTSGSRAVVSLALPEGLFERPVSLEFEIEPFLVPEQVSVQRVTVMAENKFAAFWRCDKPGIYTLRLSPEQVKNGRITLVFLMPDCYRPPDAMDDPYVRTLALFFRTVLLRRKEPPLPPQPAVVIRGKHKRTPRKTAEKAEKKVTAAVIEPAAPEPVKTVQPAVIEPAAPEPVKIPEKKEIVRKPLPAVPAEPSPVSFPPVPEKQTVKLQTLVPGKEVLFSEESDFFRASGFSDTEKDGRRTNAHTSFLRFVLPDLRDLPLPALEFQAAPAAEECVESVIRLNGIPVGKWKCSHADKYYILLGGISRKGGVLTVTFELPNAKVPQKMAHLPGARELALLFCSVKLIPDIRKVQIKPEDRRAPRKLSELQPVPGETAVLPGKSGKFFLLKGFTAEPGGDAVNRDKISSFVFIIPRELAGTVPVAELEIEPASAENSVLYLNILVDGVPEDSIVCTRRQKFFFRLKSADSAPVEISMECSGFNRQNFQNSFRLKSITLHRESFEIPPSLMEIENKRTEDEDDRKWKAGELD